MWQRGGCKGAQGVGGESEPSGEFKQSTSEFAVTDVAVAMVEWAGDPPILILPPPPVATTYVRLAVNSTTMQTHNFEL